MEPLLSMQNITKCFDTVKALDRVQLEVASGEVHALIGANGAGKSTLMRILCGELDYEEGEVSLEGKEVFPRECSMRDAGVVMIRQELCVIPELTVAQYLFVGREPVKGLSIDDRRMVAEARELLKNVDAEFSPEERLGDLSVAEQQLVEICKALSFQVRLLVLDEPTTALGNQEIEKVFEIIRKLKQKGVSIIYISHRLEELFTISDRITVMRDGKYITTLDTASTQKVELIRLLAGRELKTTKKTASNVPPDAETVLEVRHLSTEALLRDVSFSLRKGEILGLAGLMGAGRSETARAICGIDPKTEGMILVNGKEVSIRSPKEAARNGICYLSEDRNAEGLVPNRSIIANTVLSSLDQYQRGLALNDEKMLQDAIDYNARLKTKYSDPHATITTLSGGNVQKVIIARWLKRDCPIFIFDEPTKGIDVGAKDEIYQIIADLVKNGHSVILISSEEDELFNNCDRILVMSEGKITGELDISEVTREKIMTYAMGERK